MTSSELVQVFTQFATCTGETYSDTVNREFDATARTTTKVKVFMEYGFGFPPLDDKGEQSVGPPDGEMVEIKLTCIWGEEFSITGETFRVKGYYDGGWRWFDGITAEGVMTEEKESEERFETILSRLIFEGVWGVEVDPRTVEEDPMGSLSDYE